ncbi:MAG: pitrilysin family protein [Tepidisphaeraceae bacterium]|jgi:predicted Zn-dependent peptidase
MPLKFHHHRLANGLNVIAESDPDAHSFAAGLYVNTGSRDEPEKIGGVSHFLEHMMFKGSARYTFEEVNRIFDEIGARYNAFTSQENTAYYANVLPEFTARAIAHLAQLLKPALRSNDFETEKKVILEEIAMHRDDPGYRIYEVLMRQHFGDHPLGRSVLGSTESIRRLTRQQMRKYLTAHYGPDNTVLAAAGKIDFRQIVALAEENCGSWKPSGAARHQAVPRYRARRKTLVDEKLKRQYTMAMTPGPSAQDTRRFAARVLGDVIGDAEGSRFYWALVDNAIAEEADFGFYPHDACGSFFFSLTTAPKRTAKALKIAIEELSRVQTDLTEAEVERAKNKIASSIVLDGETPMGRMRSIAANWVYNKEYRSLESDMATLLAVSADSLRSLMRDFPFEPKTIVTLGPTRNPVIPARD